MNRAVVLVDTSVFVELLDVPGKSQNRAQTLATLEQWIEHGASLLLPMAAVIETGNHIAQIKGDKRGRELAQR